MRSSGDKYVLTPYGTECVKLRLCLAEVLVKWSKGEGYSDGEDFELITAGPGYKELCTQVRRLSKEKIRRDQVQFPHTFELRPACNIAGWTQEEDRHGKRSAGKFETDNIGKYCQLATKFAEDEQIKEFNKAREAQGKKVMVRVLDATKTVAEFIVGEVNKSQLYKLTPDEEARLMGRLGLSEKSQGEEFYEVSTHLNTIVEVDATSTKGGLTKEEELHRIQEAEPRDTSSSERFSQPSIDPHRTSITPPPSRHQSVGNLHEIGSVFVGRDKEVDRVIKSLRAQHGVFVVIRGRGGVGKTHVANAAACKTSEIFDAIYQLDLENARKASDVIDEFRRIMKGDSIKTTESVCDRLNEVRTLLIVDTFERCYDARTEGSSEIKGLMEDIWDGCSQLKFVATSQFPVNFGNPVEVRLQPLDRPEEYAASLPSAVENGEYPAVRLFVDVVRNSYDHFRLTEQNGKAVVALCGLADGLPLLINILAPAFAKATQGGARKVEETLGDLMRDYHTRVIKGGKGDRRNETALLCVRWTYDLLPSSEQGILRLAASLTGEFTSEIVEYVPDSESLGYRFKGCQDDLDELVQKNLLTCVDGEYAVLQTIKRCVREITTPEEGILLERGTVESYRKLAREVGPESAPEGRPQALDSLEAQIENVRSALDSLKTNDSEAGLEMASDLWHLWWTRGYVVEGEGRIKELLDVPRQRGSRRAEARARAVLAHLIRHQGRKDEAKTLFEKCLEDFTEMEEPALESMVRRQLAIMANHDKNVFRGTRLLDDSPGNPDNPERFGQCPADEVAETVYEMGNLARNKGFLLDAPGSYEEAGENYRKAQKDLTDARGRFDRLGNRRSQATASLAIGNVVVKLELLPEPKEGGQAPLLKAEEQKDFKEARSHYLDALNQFSRGRGDVSRLTLLFERTAHVASLTNASELGAQMYGAAQGIRAKTKSTLPESDWHDFMTACEATLKERLGDDYERQIESGKAMSQNEAIDKARAFLNAT